MLKKPETWDKYWISNECLLVEDINATEYTMILGSTLCSVREQNNKIIELYFFDRTEKLKILAIEPNGFNKYVIEDNVIKRDDGAIYEYKYNGLTRVNDDRVYIAQKVNPRDLPDIVYTAYYFMLNHPLLEDYRTKHFYDIDLMDINGLRVMMDEINNYQNLDKADIVRNNLFVREEDDI